MLISVRAPPKQADVDEASVHSERLDVSPEVLRADDVEDHVDAAFRGQVLDGAGKVCRAVIDAVRGAQPLAGQALRVRPGGRKDRGAADVCELDRCRSDAARPAVNQQQFAGRKPRTLKDVRPHREERLRNCSGRRNLGARRDGQALRRRRHAVLGVSAACDERAHAVAVLPARRGAVFGRADLHDGARDFESWQIGCAGRRGITTEALHDIGSIDAGRGNLDEHFIGPGFGDWPIDGLQHLRSARMRNFNGEHPAIVPPGVQAVPNRIAGFAD
jgi:hypothetical protein